MANDVQVLVVSAGSPSETLIEALQARGLGVHAAGFADAEEEIDTFAPDLVILTGVRGAMELTALLDDDTRKIRPRIAIVARSRELTQLRGLNRQLVVSVLTQELGDRMVSERLDTLARKWAKVREESPAREPMPTLQASSLFPDGVASVRFDDETAVVGLKSPAVPAVASNAHEDVTVAVPAATAKAAVDAARAKATPPEPTNEAPAPPLSPQSAVDLNPSALQSLPASVGNRVSTPNFEALADRALGMLDALDTGIRPAVTAPEASAPEPTAGAKLDEPTEAAKAPPLSPPRIASPLTAGRSPSPPGVLAVGVTRLGLPRAEPTATSAEKVETTQSGEPSFILDSPSLLESIPPELTDDLEMVEAESIRPPALPPVSPAFFEEATSNEEKPAEKPEEKASGFDRTVALETFQTTEAKPDFLATVQASPFDGLTPLTPPAQAAAAIAASRAEPDIPLLSSAEPDLTNLTVPKKGGGGLAIISALLVAAGGFAYYQFNNTPSTPAKKSTAAVNAAAGSKTARPDASSPAAARASSTPAPEASTALVASATSSATPPDASAAPDVSAAPVDSAAPGTASAAPATDPAPVATASSAPEPKSAPTTAATPAPSGDVYRVTEAKVPSCSELVSTPPDGGIDPKHAASVFWKEARALIVKGEIAKANLAMCNAVALHAETPALEGLAMIYLTQNAPSQALVWVEKAEAARPHVRETMTLHADILSFLGKPDEALALWLSALNIPADDLRRRAGIASEDTTLGRSFMKQGDLPRAERLLRRAAALDPTNAVAAASLAEVMKKRAHSSGAAYFAAKSLELFPMNPDCELILGDLALESGDRTQAKLHYAKALSIRSDFWAAKLKIKELETVP